MTGTSWRTGRRAPATEDEWRDCVTELTPFLRCLVRTFERDVATRDDIVQGCWLKAWRKAPSYTGEAAFGTWLYAVARNHCLDVWRQGQRSRRLGEPVNAAAVADLLAAPRAIDDFALLRALPPESRLVAEGYTMDEAADRLGLPRSTLRSRLFRWRMVHGAACYDRLAGTLSR